MAIPKEEQQLNPNRIKRLHGIYNTLKSKGDDEGLAEFTAAKAEKLLSDTYIKIVEEETMKTIATRKIIAEIAVKEDPTVFERNPAGVGQLVNLTMENIKRRLEDGDKKD